MKAHTHTHTHTRVGPAKAFPVSYTNQMLVQARKRAQWAHTRLVLVSLLTHGKNA